jgi:hypothetical protein
MTIFWALVWPTEPLAKASGKAGSVFCSFCGKEFSDYIKGEIGNLLKALPDAPRIAGHRETPGNKRENTDPDDEVSTDGEPKAEGTEERVLKFQDD